MKAGLKRPQLKRLRLKRLRWRLTRPLRRLARMRAGMRRGGGWENLFPDDPGFHSGVREPRRPKPTPPADSVALRIPKE